MPHSEVVERLFIQLVQNLAALDPGRLTRPFPIAEISASLVPYRTHRSQLGFETVEDYEMALLRLLAGEGGFAVLESEDAGLTFAREAASINPDLGLHRKFGASTIRLDPDRVGEALSAGRTSAPEDESVPAAAPSPAPPAPDPSESSSSFADASGAELAQLPFELEEDPNALPAPTARPREPAAGSGCPYCGGDLPIGRAVLFCPHCGQNIGVVHCPTCSSELDVGWQFCIACGQHVTGGLG